MNQNMNVKKFAGNLLVLLILFLLVYSCSNPYFKNYYSNFKMSGYFIQTTEPLYYLGKKQSDFPYGCYYFVPDKYVKRAKYNTLIFKENPVFYIIEIKNDKEQYLLKLQRKYIYNNEDKYSWYTHNRILFKKEIRQKYSDYNINGYSICFDGKDTVNPRINCLFFLVQILE
jgi:hypothetical protein